MVSPQIVRLPTLAISSDVMFTLLVFSVPPCVPQNPGVRQASGLQRLTVEQLALLPEQDSHKAALHDVVAGLKLSGGQVELVPVQLAPLSHGP